MASASTPAEFEEIRTELDAILSPNHELFSLLVATGTAYREAASSAGFSATYGAYLMKTPRILERVGQLVEMQRGEPASRAWAVGALMRIALEALNGTPDREVDGKAIKGMAPDRALARQAIMDICKVKGYIVERKQIDTRSAHVDLTKLGRTELMAALDRSMAQLPARTRSRVEKLLAVPNVEGPEELEPAEPAPAEK